jgi:hypothetical protein
VFFKKAQPQAIKGDVIGEALAEVREQIGKYGWTTGGTFTNEYSPMCLGNAIGFVAFKKEEYQYTPLLMSLLPPWSRVHNSQLGMKLVYALGFANVDGLWHWNDRLMLRFVFYHRRGRKAVIQRINVAIEKRNREIIWEAHKAALAEDAEREKLYVPAEWKPRTVSGEEREKVTA